MPTTRTYLDYLNEKVDISPANSQEELDEARLVEGLMREHGLEVKLQEFEANGAAGVARNCVYVGLFLGMLLVGILGTPASIVGLLLVIAVMALLFAEQNGRKFLRDVGPRVQSQNVIGVHRAEGPLVGRGTRPIVIVAHYDSPNENVLYDPRYARYHSILRTVRFGCICAVGICSLLQIIGIIPALARHIFWVIGILSSIVPLAIAIADSYERFAPATIGANDNKSSVAALLGLIDTVRPADDEAKRYMALHPSTSPVEEDDDEGEELPVDDGGFAAEGEELGEEESCDAEAYGAEAYDEEPDQPQAVSDELEPARVFDEAPEPQVETVSKAAHKTIRRGPDFMHSLNILPEDCEIVYQKPPVPKVTLPEIEDEPLPTAEDYLPVMAAAGEVYPSEGDHDHGRYEPGQPTGRVATFFSSIFGGRGERRFEPETSDDDLPPVAEFEVVPDEQAAAVAADNDSVETEALADEQPSANAAQDIMASIRDFFDGVMDKLAGPADEEPAEDVAEAGEPVQAKADLTASVEETASIPTLETAVIDVESAEAVRDEEGLPEKDTSGLDTLDDETMDQTRPSEVVPEPAPIEDEGWGTSDFSPEIARGGVARRATLLDLPNPSELASDPFVDEEPEVNPDQEPIDFIMGADPLAGDDDHHTWKGGATTRSGLRRDSEAAPVEAIGYELGGYDEVDPGQQASGYELAAEDVTAEQDVSVDDETSGALEGAEVVEDTAGAESREVTAAEADDKAGQREAERAAILGMSDDELLCHDIWFVAVGSSSLEHAGIKSFLKEHRRDIRGAFLVNLDSIGAGDLTLLTTEGAVATRRADRRIGKGLLKTAADLHIDLGRMRYEWTSTDATPAMRSSVRSATIMGVDANGLPALSRTQDDVPENVDAGQVVKVVELVSEFIRRA